MKANISQPQRAVKLDISDYDFWEFEEELYLLGTLSEEALHREIRRLDHYARKYYDDYTQFIRYALIDASVDPPELRFIAEMDMERYQERTGKDIEEILPEFGTDPLFGWE